VLALAIAIARRFGSRITLVHACWIPGATRAAYLASLYLPVDEVKHAASQVLDALVTDAKGTYPNIEGIVTYAPPVEVILDMARERQADLIVMGTHGRSGLPRALLGSVAERVVRISPVPVLTVSGKAAITADVAAT
jgi:nucleotide-binding universal stress UspA family protein